MSGVSSPVWYRCGVILQDLQEMYVDPARKSGLANVVLLTDVTSCADTQPNRQHNCENTDKSLVCATWSSGAVA